jgi:hypothetical protein
MASNGVPVIVVQHHEPNYRRGSGRPQPCCRSGEPVSGFPNGLAMIANNVPLASPFYRNRGSASMGDDKPNIGLKQGNILCGMKYDDRLNFIGKGLPIVLESALRFWNASRQLQSSPREATVLENLAVEEAGKLLILMDIVRCPEKIVSVRIGQIVRWLYQHLPRTIYANAASWHPMNLGRLRDYVEYERHAHYVEGNLGEYIVPNSKQFGREGALYADIGKHDDGEPYWNRPTGYQTELPFLVNYKPAALSLAEAFSALGMLSARGVQIVASTWDALEFKDDEQTAQDSKRLIQTTIEAVIDSGLASNSAEQSHVETVRHHWQMPMYNLDFALIPVSRDDLEREQDRLFNSERW